MNSLELSPVITTKPLIRTPKYMTTEPTSLKEEEKTSLEQKKKKEPDRLLSTGANRRST
jgi:hypothetical protein